MDKAAKAAYMRGYYRRNKERWNSKRVAQHRLRKERLAKIKQERGCVLCGYNASACALDFHHRDPAEKCFQISGTGSSARAWHKVAAEIEKCDVMCANCHRMLHCTL